MRAGVAAAAACTLLLGTGSLAWGGSAPAFTRTTEPEVVAPTPLRDLTTPFLAWAADPGVGFLGGGGLYADDGTLRVARTCGTGARAASAAATGGIVGVLGDDGRVCTWDGLEPRALVDVAAHAAALAVGRADSADGRQELDTAVYTRGSAATAIDARTGQKLWSRDPDLGPLTSAAASGSGGLYAVGGQRGAAVLYGASGRLVRAVTTGRREASGARVDDPVSAVALDADGARLATGQTAGVVTIWDTRTGRAIRTVDLGEGAVVDLDWSRDGQQLAAVSRIPGASGATLEFEVWDLGLDTPLFRVATPDPAAARPVLRFSPWGLTLVGSDGAGFSRVWQRPSRYIVHPGDPLRESPHHRGTRASVDAVHMATLADGPFDTLAGASGWAAPAESARLAEDAQSGRSLWVDRATGTQLAVYGPDGRVVARHALTQRAVAAGLAGDRFGVIGADGSLRATAHLNSPVSATREVRGATAVAFGRDGGVVWGSAAGDVTFAPRAAGETPRVYTVHAGPVAALATSADGAVAVSVGPRVVDPGAPDAAPTLGVSVLLRDPESRGAVASSVVGASMGFSWVVDGRTATVALRDDRALVRTDAETVVFDLQRGGRLLTLPWAARDAAFGAGDTVRWIDPAGHVRVAPLAAGVDRPRGRPLCTDRLGAAVATLDADVLTLWNGDTGRQGQSLAPTGTRILGCGFNDGGKKLAFLQEDGRFEVWSTDSMTAQAGLSGAAVDAPWFAFAPESADEAARERATGESASGSAWIRTDATHVARIELAHGAVAERVELPAGVARIDATPGRFAALLGADGVRLGTLDLDASLPAGGRRSWDADAQPIAAHEGTYAWVADARLWVGPAAGPALPGPLPGGAVRAAAFSPDGKLLAIADDQNVVALVGLPFRDVRTMPAGAPPRSPRPSPPIERLWFDGPELVGRDTLGRTRSWAWMAAAGGDIAALRPGPIGAVPAIYTLRASPDGRTLYSGQADALVRAWDVDTATQRTAYLGAYAPVRAVAPSADGRWLAIGGDDGMVRVVDTVTKVSERSFPTFDEPSRGIAIAQEGGRWLLAAQSDRGTIRAWDLVRGTPLLRWTGAPLGALAWLPGLDALGYTLDGVTYRLGLDTDAAPAASPAPATPPAPVDGPWAALAGGRWASTDAAGHIVLWDGSLPYARLTLLDDGGWISDRIDGRQIASESLRDGTSLLLYQHGGMMEPNTNERVAARMAAAVVAQGPAVEACLASGPDAPPGSALTLSWQVSAGVLRKTRVTADTTGSAGLAGCVVDAIDTLRFDLEMDTPEVQRTWAVAGGPDVRVLALDPAEGASTVEAVRTALAPAHTCRARPETRLQWRVEAGKLHVVPVAGADDPAVACLTSAVDGARVDGVERASGVWTPAP